jgi:hypothetical protein
MKNTCMPSLGPWTIGIKKHVIIWKRETPGQAWSHGDSTTDIVLKQYLLRIWGLIPL